MTDFFGSLDHLAASSLARPIANPQLNRDYQRQRQMTLGDLLLENRIIFLQGEIHDGNANEMVMKMVMK